MAKNYNNKKYGISSDNMKIAQKINPFELRFNKQKSDVCGRKRKHDRGLPGIARSKAVKKRQKTILQEYLSANKNNKFVDRRIGENVLSFNKEDKMMARYSQEMKKRLKKRNMYNLNEDEELTHLGRKLSNIDKFDNPGSDSEEEGKLDSEFVRTAHFGGVGDEKTGVKMTRKEKMDEIISESKKRKYEKKSEIEANLDLTEKLDNEWKSIAGLLSKSKKTEDIGVAKGTVDDYDLKVRELKFEAKGHPSERLKSAEEIALEESNKLQKLEEERIKRMQSCNSTIAKTTTLKHVSADDLYDGFTLNEDDVMAEKNGEDEADLSKKEDDEENKSSSDLTDNSDDSDSYSDVLCDEDVYGSEENKPECNAVVSDEMPNNSSNLPFVLTVPSSLEDFLKVILNHSVEEQAVIVDRIIKNNHPSLGASNKKKLEKFFSIFLKYVLGACNDCKLDLKLLDVLSPHFVTLLRFSKKAISESLLNVMKKYQDTYQKKLKWNSLNSFPDLGILYLFKIIHLLYPTSDFRHPAVTPAMIFMSQLLTKCQLNTFRDVACCLLLCETFYEYVSYSKHLVPEAISSIHKILCSMTNGHIASLMSSPSCEDEVEQSKEIDLLSVINLEKVVPSKQIRKWVLFRVVCIATKFAKLYKELPSFLELFNPILQTVDSGEQFSADVNIKDQCHALIEELKKPSIKSALTLQGKKPKSLRQYEPKFDMVFTGRRERVGSRKKLEQQKLVHKYKREMKGAVREIRRDNHFLAGQQLREQMQRDEERKRKVKELYAELAQQEGDFKRMKRKSKLISF